MENNIKNLLDHVNEQLTKSTDKLTHHLGYCAFAVLSFYLLNQGEVVHKGMFSAFFVMLPIICYSMNIVATRLILINFACKINDKLCNKESPEYLQQCCKNWITRAQYVAIMLGWCATMWDVTYVFGIFSTLFASIFTALTFFVVLYVAYKEQQLGNVFLGENTRTEFRDKIFTARVKILTAIVKTFTAIVKTFKRVG